MRLDLDSRPKAGHWGLDEEGEDGLAMGVPRGASCAALFAVAAGALCWPIHCVSPPAAFADGLRAPALAMRPRSVGRCRTQYHLRPAFAEKRVPRGVGSGHRATTALRVLAANSRELGGGRFGKNDTSAIGKELQEVQISAREIWDMMVPTERALQARIGVSLVLLLVCRLANLMVPLTFKRAIDILSELQASAAGAAAVASSAASAAHSAALLQLAVTTVGMFFVWKLTQGLGEVLRQYLWVAVQSDLKRRISERLLRHIHALSLRFHVTSKSGQTLQIMDKGTSGLESMMEIIPFRLFPALCDVLLVVGIFCALDKPAIAAIAGGTIAVYASLTYVVTQWRTKYWRQMVQAEITYKGRAVESLQNVETVKFFAAESHELAEYSGLVSKWQAAKQRSERTLAVLNASQKVVICVGLTAVLYVSLAAVAAGSMTVGDLVMTTTYMEQLYTPLTWLGTIYRMSEDSLVDMERMFKLLKLQPEVRDRPAAAALAVSRGAVEFDQVSFSYDGGRTPVLRNVSLVVEAGQTFALVGESGGGKSTVGRLLFRLYDVESGAIRIDGVDIRDVTQRSLREAIGVVPQETTLFNNRLDYNIWYGTAGVQGSAEGGGVGIDGMDVERVEAAARLAQMHERVLGWADGYQTGVGEKGMRLSGGEKQRVGIARTFIKNPQIVVLDEATSALDSQTEEQIQAALAAACQGRTAIVIAHRLSTVVNADVIGVVKGGQLVEVGGTG